MTEFLGKILSIDADHASVVSAQLGFRGGFLPVWLAAVLFVFLTALAVYLYARAKGAFGWPRRIALITLRSLLFGLLLFLLMRPMLLLETKSQRARSVVVLLDNSESMTQQDRRLTDDDKARVAIAKNLLPLTTNLAEIKSASSLPTETPKDPSRADLARWILAHPELKLLPRLAEKGPLQPLLFGPSVHGPREGGEGKAAVDLLLASFTANEPKTGLADGILEILQRKDGDLPAAIVVFTDGQDNLNKSRLEDAADACLAAGVPLHVLGLGTADGGTLQLKEVATPETIFVDDNLTVPLRWRAQGFKKGDLEVTLSLAGKVVAKKDLTIKNGEDIRETLSFSIDKGLEKLEKSELSATIRVKGNDQFKDTLTRPVQIVDGKIKVLCIESSTRFEFKFLQPALLRDRRIEPTFLLLNADPKVANSGPPFLPAFPTNRKDFFGKYNLIILGDVPASAFSKEQMEWIKEFVRERGGLIAVAGRLNMPASYENTPLAEILPVEFVPTKFTLDTQTGVQEYQPTLTDFGQRSDMLSLADTPEESAKIWAKLPGFFFQYPVTKLRPGATPLVVNPRAKLAGQPMPLVATHYYGQGQVLFAGSDETWRWRFNVQDKYFVRYWGQIIYQMGLPHLLEKKAKRAQFSLEGAEAVLNKQGSVFVRLLKEEDYGPRKDLTVEAVQEHLDAKPGQEKTRTIKLNLIPGRDGEYRALLPHDKPGRFEIRISNPEPNSFYYRVDPPPLHELEETGMAEKSLRYLAEKSGGRFYREESVKDMPVMVTPKLVDFIRRQEATLYPIAMLLFILLITAEWLVRKFANLS